MSSRSANLNQIQISSSAWYLLPLVPLVLLPLGYYYVRRYLAARKLARTGIGRGAPGFQTGVKRIAVTPEIAARLRAGEYVSPEEIDAAVAKAKAKQNAKEKGDEDENEKKKEKKKADGSGEENEWIPEGNRRFAKGGSSATPKGKKRR